MPVGTPFDLGRSGNPGGRPKKFLTQLSDAVREHLGAFSEEYQAVYADVIGGEMVEAAAKMAKKANQTGEIPKELLFFFREATDRTEGKPIQKVVFADDPNADPTERIKQLLAKGKERLAGRLGTGGTKRNS